MRRAGHPLARSAATIALIAACAGMSRPERRGPPEVPPEPPDARLAADDHRRRDDPGAKILKAIISIPALPLRAIQSIEGVGKGASDLAEAGNRMADVAETMPATLRHEIEAMDDSMARAERIADAVERTSFHVSEAGRNWDAALVTLADTVRTIRDDGSGPGGGGDGAVKMADVVQISGDLATTATELRRLAEQVNELVVSDRLDTRIRQVDATAASTVNRTAFHARTLADRLFWRVTQLAMVIVLSMTLYRVLCAVIRLDERKRRAATAARAKSAGVSQVDEADPGRDRLPPQRPTITADGTAHPALRLWWDELDRDDGPGNRRQSEAG